MWETILPLGVELKVISSIILNCVAEIGVEGIHVAAIPRDLDCVADSALNAAGCGGILLCNGRVEYLSYGVYHLVVVDGHQYGTS